MAETCGQAHGECLGGYSAPFRPVYNAVVNRSSFMHDNSEAATSVGGVLMLAVLTVHATSPDAASMRVRDADPGTYTLATAAEIRCVTIPVRDRPCSRASSGD